MQKNWLLTLVITTSTVFIAYDQRLSSVEGLKCGYHIPNKDNAARARQAKDGETPFLVEIENVIRVGDVNKTFICAGAIISRTQILTSIKCAPNEKQDIIETKLLVGSNKSGAGTKLDLDKTKTQTHSVATDQDPDCGVPRAYYGLAILTTSSNITYKMKDTDLYINKACLRISTSDQTYLADGADFNVTSWFDGGQASIVTSKKSVCGPKGATNIFCATSLGQQRLKPLLEGSPLISDTTYSRWTVHGIHSLGYLPWDDDCIQRNKSEVERFVQLSAVRDWILDKIKK